MRELRHITKKRLKKRHVPKGRIIVVFLVIILILAGAYSFLRRKTRPVSVDLTPGNIYTDIKDQKQQTGPDEEGHSMPGAAGQEESVKGDHFTFYNVLNSKEGDIMPLNVEPPRHVKEKEQYTGPHQEDNTDQIDSEIVKKIGARDKEGIIYTVQIGALRQEKAANELAMNIRSKGYAPYITKENGSGSPPVFKVRIGKFLSMVDAQEVAAVLKSEGFATYVIKTSINE